MSGKLRRWKALGTPARLKWFSAVTPEWLAGAGSLRVGLSIWKVPLARRSPDPVPQGRGSSGPCHPPPTYMPAVLPRPCQRLVSVLGQGREDVPPPPRSPPLCPVSWRRASAADICPTHLPGSPLPCGRRHANEPLPQADLARTVSHRKSSRVQNEAGPCSDTPSSL